MTTVSISLPESLKKFVDRQVRSKGYGNVSEYFRGLLREAQERESQAKLEGLLLQGIESGEDIKIDREFWKDLKSEAAVLIAKRRERS